MTKSNNRLPIDTKIRLVLLKSGITWPAFYAADPECYTQSGGLTTVNGAMTAGSVAIDGGTLRGTGIINGSVTSSGTVASGTSPGMLTINGNYTQTDTGRLLIELGGYDQGINYDFLNITGDATLKGILQIAFSTGFTAATGSYFDIMKASNILGTFEKLNAPNSPVPVPAAFWLLASGLIGLAGKKTVNRFKSCSTL